MMKPVQTLEDIRHLVEESDEEILEQIQKYIDHQLIFLEEEQAEYLTQKQA